MERLDSEGVEVVVGPTEEVVLEATVIMKVDTIMSMEAVVGEIKPGIIEVFIVYLEENMIILSSAFFILFYLQMTLL